MALAETFSFFASWVATCYSCQPLMVQCLYYNMCSLKVQICNEPIIDVCNLELSIFMAGWEIILFCSVSTSLYSDWMSQPMFLVGMWVFWDQLILVMFVIHVYRFFIEICNVTCCAFSRGLDHWDIISYLFPWQDS